MRGQGAPRQGTMENNKRYNEFLKGLGSVLRGAPAHAAPAHLADRIMKSVASQAPGFDWGLRPALAASGVIAVLCVASLQEPRRAGAPEAAAPEIVSFTVDKTLIAPQEPVTLRWRVANADSVLIEHSRSAVVQSRHDDSITFSLLQPGEYKFVLVAMSDAGTTRMTLEGTP